MNNYLLIFFLIILTLGILTVIILLWRRKGTGDNAKLDSLTERLIQQSEKLANLSSQC